MNLKTITTNNRKNKCNRAGSLRRLIKLTIPCLDSLKKKDTNKIRDERGEITTDMTEIQRII